MFSSIGSDTYLFASCILGSNARKSNTRYVDRKQNKHIIAVNCSRSPKALKSSIMSIDIKHVPSIATYISIVIVFLSPPTEKSASILA